ncbi:DivIVA domain-containing protein [Arthrobacter sp. 35W]|uniref:DivIVA domain-containing protein n=1 Tax=Arthrobacter sp. 35W TaxID=1132441 RepID=UPI0004040934|nr:DivIVA domain-containing protein [Arthrobacter sp. 35W]
MSYFLVFLAVLLAGAVAFYALGLKKRPETVGLPDGYTEPVANLPPVLLPHHPVPEDVDHLRFSLGLRGYRMDQVDEVLDRLRDELAAKDARIASLEAAVGLPAEAQREGGQ